MYIYYTVQCIYLYTRCMCVNVYIALYALNDLQENVGGRRRQPLADALDLRLRLQTVAVETSSALQRGV